MARRDKHNGTPTRVLWQFSFDTDQDVAFINQLSSEGWKVVEISYGMRFVFVPCEPGEYICQALFAVRGAVFPDKAKYQELTELLVESGAEVVPQTKSLGSRASVIALREASLGPWEVNTDIDSKLREYQQRRNFSLVSALVLLLEAVICLVNALTTTEPGPATVVWLYGLAAVGFLIAGACAYSAFTYIRIIQRLRVEREVREV
ncbi:MAG: DUF2812 domain-containing protein [Propionibacteriaceae bacterium]|jgi:hypothetical protein|nr:DUF2812 domain-containing protein [Propionibacteriaceae bacterium]